MAGANQGLIPLAAADLSCGQAERCGALAHLREYARPKGDRAKRLAAWRVLRRAHDEWPGRRSFRPIAAAEPFWHSLQRAAAIDASERALGFRQQFLAPK